MNHDGRVDFLDFTLFAEQYGQTEESHAIFHPPTSEETGDDDDTTTDEGISRFLPFSIRSHEKDHSPPRHEYPHCGIFRLSLSGETTSNQTLFPKRISKRLLPLRQNKNF